MGFLDAVKGLLGSEVVQGALESTPLGDLAGQVGPLEDGAAVAEAVGVDVGQLTESVPGAEALTADLAPLAGEVATLGGVDPPVP